MGVPRPNEITVREARERYFAENGLSDEGYTSSWVKLPVGPFKVYFPNTGARRRAVVLHDLHHVATGYSTTWRGEAEIAAWELAAGCGRYWAAWGLNLGAAAVGMVIAPRRTARAWRRGRASHTLYGAAFDPAILDLTVSQLRRRLELSS